MIGFSELVCDVGAENVFLQMNLHFSWVVGGEGGWWEVADRPHGLVVIPYKSEVN